MVTGGAQAGTTYYYNGNDSLDLSYEKTIKANGVTEHKHYISLPGSNGQWLLGQFVQRSGNLASNPASSRAAQEFNYFHQDAQGSTVAVSDSNGQIQERMAYDPWGDRRNVTGPSDPNNLIAAEKTDRGYTQHEMLDEVGLVHMNGRIYDPTLGRMLTADILVSYPERSTSYNRYAYALNNPLRFVDPSGWDVLALGPDTVRGYRQQSQAEINSSYDFGLQSSKNGIPLANQGLSLGLKASQPQATISNPSATDAVLHAYDNEYLDGHGYRFVMYANEGIYTNALVEFAGATFNIFDGRRKQAASIVGRGIKSTKKTVDSALNSASLKIGEGVKSKADVVIAETLAGKGNFTSATKLSSGELLQAGEKFLGPGYKEIGKLGSGVFRSADGTRQFRIDGNSLLGKHAPFEPHGHLQTIDLVKDKSTSNNHIPFFD